MEKNANTIEIREIMKLYSKGILFNFKPYETLIAKLSMFAAIPINKYRYPLHTYFPLQLFVIIYLYEQMGNSVRARFTK